MIPSKLDLEKLAFFLKTVSEKSTFPSLETVFRKNANFSKSSFDGIIDFSSATFIKNADFEMAEFTYSVNKRTLDYNTQVKETYEQWITVKA
jgi:hypothetical protein